MKIKYTNFRRIIEIGAFSGSGETIIFVLFLIFLFGGLAFFFREVFIAALFFVALTLACIYALANEVLVVPPEKKDK